MRVFLRNIVYKMIFIYHWFLVLKLRNKKKVNVVFFAMNLSMWRYQHLYELMVKHSKFNVYIIITPCLTYAKEQQELDLENLRAYFSKQNIPFIEPVDSKGEILDVKKVYNPDILFYSQPYFDILNSKHDISYFLKKLICYHPYAFWLGQEDWGFNLKSHNLAWKLFYATKIHYSVAKKLAINKGRNVSIVGYSNADDFLFGIHTDVWKSQERLKKKIIWAPHFTINQNRCFTAHSTFLWIADFMLQLAKEYSDRIQFAFKPHPRLLTELYVNTDWGKEKADAYYKQWETMPNTQFEKGNFVDLFMSSDAMIHDCGSFCAEYHYTQKPVMFISQNIDPYRDTFNDFGKKAIDLHYLGKTQADIIDFIENVVLNNNDVRLAERVDFYKKYLLPPNGKKVAENMLDDILKALK